MAIVMIVALSGAAVFAVSLECELAALALFGAALVATKLLT